MPDAPSKVVRYGRHEMEEHQGEANATITAGDLVTENNDGTIDRASSLTQNDRLLVALDARERGIEQGDDYAAGENVPYARLSGGGVTVLLADGQTLDVSAENRLVLSGTAGKVRPFNADNPVDVLFRAQEDSDITASGSHEPVDAEVY